VGRPDLWDDERFQSNAGRVEHRDTLVPLLQELFSSRTAEAWIELLLEAKIPVGPINDIPTILADPQVAARQMVQEVEHKTAGIIQMLGPVAKLSKTPAEIRQAPPTLGGDSDRVLSELGYTPEQIKALREEDVI